MKKFFTTKRSFLVKEDDLVKALKVLSRRRLDCFGVNVSRCNGMEKGKWCIEVYASNKEWAAVEGIFIREGINTY